MEVILNIGQNNNRITHKQVVETVREWFNAENMEQLEETATYKGESEPTTVVQFSTDTNINTIVTLIEDLCKATTQESIAVKAGEYKLLVYNPTYKGEVMNFDDNLFIHKI